VEGPRATYRRVLRERDFRLLITAQTQSAMGGWAYNVALIVYIYDQTHSADWVAAGTLGRMIPRFFASLYAGVIAERMERIRLMVRADCASAVVLGAMAGAAALHMHAAVLVVLAALSSIIASVYDPSTAAMVPQLLGEDMLAAGNALLETINNVAIIVGPAVGALVLLIGKPSLVMALDAATFAVSAALVARVRTRSRPTDVTKSGGPLRQIMVGITAITESANAMILVSFSIVTTGLYGVDTVLFVFLSKNKLGTGASGYGYLLVALGVGGVIASVFVNRLASMPRLSLILAAGMIAYAAPTALLVSVHSPTLAFIIEAVRGVATLIVDVLAMTALQRSLAPDLISRVFGVFWAVCIGGLSIGAFVTPFLLNATGIDTTQIPFSSGALALQGILAGTTDAFVASTLYAVSQKGKLRALAIAGPKRMDAWPDVPTLIEAGFDIDIRGFVGLGAPAKTPKPIVAYLNKRLNEVLQTDTFKKPMAALGMAPPPAADNTPEKFDKFFRDEIARQGVLAELTGQKIAPPKQ